ncbi:cytochrome c [Pyxidicoccus fallax]|uniref:Cytochrome c n=1 Tax=Pyxidicoccus fallax TaxID=394095 RepID=A0A848LPJ4_9BACT|nr:cytochrome c [Pyxidicoccus fallax]NMO19798.1 cytochrome c [Pyxidicoccus fallax]NPC84194.1 cytochrome c [Pyxidicoccus fallax]
MMKTLRTGLLVALVSLGLVMQARASEPAPPKSAAPKSAAPKGDKKAAKPAPSLPVPPYMPEGARAALRQKMERHGQAMTDLMLGVMLLQYEVAGDAAGRIVNEPRLGRPIPGGDDELNSLLPERFFTLQDELRSRAQAVEAAAKKRDDAALAESFGQLTQTCVSCHSVYLNHRP